MCILVERALHDTSAGGACPQAAFHVETQRVDLVVGEQSVLGVIDVKLLSVPAIDTVVRCCPECAVVGQQQVVDAAGIDALGHILTPVTKDAASVGGRPGASLSVGDAAGGAVGVAARGLHACHAVGLIEPPVACHHLVPRTSYPRHISLLSPLSTLLFPHVNNTVLPAAAAIGLWQQVPDGLAVFCCQTVGTRCLAAHPDVAVMVGDSPCQVVAVDDGLCIVGRVVAQCARCRLVDKQAVAVGGNEQTALPVGRDVEQPAPVHRQRGIGDELQLAGLAAVREQPELARARSYEMIAWTCALVQAVLHLVPHISYPRTSVPSYPRTSHV